MPGSSVDLVNEWNGSGEPTLTQVQAEFAQWTVYRAADRLCHADPPLGSHYRHVRGEDPCDLRDMIIRELWRSAGRPETLQQGRSGPEIHEGSYERQAR